MASEPRYVQIRAKARKMDPDYRREWASAILHEESNRAAAAGNTELMYAWNKSLRALWDAEELEAHWHWRARRGE